METPTPKSESFHSTLSRTILASAIIVIIFHRLVVPIDATIQWIFFGISIGLAGIPHGALDHLVAKQNNIVRQRPFSSFNFYIKYLGKMFLFGLCWYLFPTTALILFILMSSFHFGETDINIPKASMGLIAMMFQTIYGLFIILTLLFSHTDSVIPIVNLINGNDLSPINYVFQPIVSKSILSITGLFLILTGIIFQVKNRLPISFYTSLLIQTICILTILILLPLPLAFGFYFGCWHSLLSLENIRLHISQTGKKTMSWNTLIQQCIPFTMLAFLGIAVLILLTTYSNNQNVYLLGFFIGIAILTAPHLEVMSHMYTELRLKKS